jgi:hypothetical protein
VRPDVLHAGLHNSKPRALRVNFVSPNGRKISPLFLESN